METPEMEAQQRETQETNDRFERHRPFVRDLDKQVRSLYAFGGGAVLVAVAATLGLWALFDTLWAPLPWLSAVAVALGGLLVLRTVVLGRADGIVRRFREYCQTNELSPASVRSYFTRDEMYPYFEGLFELLQRHRELRGDGDGD